MKIRSEGTESIESVIDADFENAKSMLHGLRNTNPDLVSLADELANIVSGIGIQFGASGTYDKYTLLFNEHISRIKGSPLDLTRLLKNATLLGQAPADDPLGEAKDAFERSCSFIVRIWLLLRFKRDYHWGLSQLFMRRLSPSFGYLRLQAETAATIAMSLDPKFADEWLATAETKTAKVFHTKRYSQIREKMKQLGWNEYFEMGSSYAQHSAAAGLMHSISGARKAAPAGTTGIIYQEVEDPRLMVLWYVYYLRAHQSFVGGILTAFPEADLVELRARYMKLNRSIENVWVEVIKNYQAHRKEILDKEYMEFPEVGIGQDS